MLLLIQINPIPILGPMVRKLIRIVKNGKRWHNRFTAYPAGLYNVVNLVGELALHLMKEHSKLDISRQLIEMLQEVFEDDNELASRIGEHAKALDETIGQKEDDWGCVGCAGAIVIFWILGSVFKNC